MKTRERSRPLGWCLLAAFVIITLLQLRTRALLPPDEGRYATMARDMLASGDWITTRLNGIKYFEKPPLQTWMSALSFGLFGLGEWQARLWTGLNCIFGVLFTAWTGRRVFGRPAGLYAGLVLASCAYWIAAGQMASLDMGLAGMMTLALGALLLAQRAGVDPRERRNWMLACWAGMALAVLSKGLVGIVLPGAVLALYTLITRDWSLWRRLHLGKGLLLFLAITAPWFVLVALKNPEQPYFFFIHEHVDRYLDPGHDREGPWWTYLPLLAAGAIPWLGVLFQSLLAGARSVVPVQAGFHAPAASKLSMGSRLRGNDAVTGAEAVVPAEAGTHASAAGKVHMDSRLRQNDTVTGLEAVVPAQAGTDAPAAGKLSMGSRRRGNDTPRPFQPRLLLLIWVLFTIVFFSASRSKLPGYIVPVFPALALLVATYLQTGSRSGRIAAGLTTTGLGIALICIAPSVTRFAKLAGEAAQYEAWEPWVLAAGFVSALGGALATLYARQLQRDLTVLVLAVAGFASAHLLVAGFDGVVQRRAGANLLPAIRAELRPDTRIYTVSLYEQSLSFYLGRPVTLVAYQDEFSFGLRQQPHLALPSVAAFEARWRAEAAAGVRSIAIVHADRAAAMRRLGLPVRVIAADARRTVIANY